MAGGNTLAYYVTATITTIMEIIFLHKLQMVQQAIDLVLSKLFQVSVM
jgi:hypothetical protein